MLRISICHRSKKIREMLLEYIANIQEIEDEYMTECFSDILSVKQRIDAGDFCFDLLLLEMDASGIGGIFLAKYIHEIKWNVDVIFIAENMNFVNEAFRCKVNNYIAEPISFEKFSYEMVQYLKQRNDQKDEYLQIFAHGKKQIIPLKAVLCFVSEARKICAIFSNGSDNVWFYGKLNDLEQEIGDKGFIRCHQSYLVNVYKVESVGNETVQVKDHFFPISRKYKETIYERFDKKEYV